MKKLSAFWRWGYLALIYIFLYAPILVMMVFSFNESRSRGVWTGFSLKWYQSALQNDEIMRSLYYTVLIAVLAAVISTVLGTLAAIGLEGMKKRTQNAVMNLTYIPVLNPDIVTGVSLMLLFVVFCNIQLGFVTLLCAHITFCMPYVMLSVSPKLKQMDYNIYEAAVDLGASPAFALRKVVLPELMPGIITGAIMAFTLSLDDFVVSFFTTGSGVSNLSITIYSMARRGVSPELNAISTIMFVTVLLLLLIVNWRAEKESKRAREGSF